MVPYRSPIGLSLPRVAMLPFWSINEPSKRYRVRPRIGCAISRSTRHNRTETSSGRAVLGKGGVRLRRTCATLCRNHGMGRPSLCVRLEGSSHSVQGVRVCATAVSWSTMSPLNRGQCRKQQKLSGSPWWLTAPLDATLFGVSSGLPPRFNLGRVDVPDAHQLRSSECRSTSSFGHVQPGPGGSHHAVICRTNRAY